MAGVSVLELASPQFSDNREKGLSQGIDASFVLQNILEVPEIQIEEYLHSLDKWRMEFCGKCEDTIDKAKSIYKEMVEVQKRFKEVKFQIINKIMSIQHGIKCGDKGLEIRSETTEVASQDEVTETENQTKQGQVDELAKENENSATREDNMDVEPQDHTPTSHRNQTDARSPKSPKRKSSTISKNSKTLHGLVMGGRKTLPKSHDGPVQCKCGKQYSKYDKLLRHVKETLTNPNELLRCDICFEANPSVLVTFKRPENLKSHVRGKHEGKRVSCHHCKKSVYPQNIKKHIKQCSQNKK